MFYFSRLQDKRVVSTSSAGALWCPETNSQKIQNTFAYRLVRWAGAEETLQSLGCFASLSCIVHGLSPMTFYVFFILIRFTNKLHGLVLWKGQLARDVLCKHSLFKSVLLTKKQSLLCLKALPRALMMWCLYRTLLELFWTKDLDKRFLKAVWEFRLKSDGFHKNDIFLHTNFDTSACEACLEASYTERSLCHQRCSTNWQEKSNTDFPIHGNSEKERPFTVCLNTLNSPWHPFEMLGLRNWQSLSIEVMPTLFKMSQSFCLWQITLNQIKRISQTL